MQHEPVGNIISCIYWHCSDSCLGCLYIKILKYLENSPEQSFYKTLFHCAWPAYYLANLGHFSDSIMLLCLKTFMCESPQQCYTRVQERPEWIKTENRAYVVRVKTNTIWEQDEDEDNVQFATLTVTVAWSSTFISGSLLIFINKIQLYYDVIQWCMISRKQIAILESSKRARELYFAALGNAAK